MVVSGSWESTTATTWLRLEGAPIDEAAVAAFCRRPSVGAVVTFAGTVRDQAEGLSGIIALHYEVALELAAARLDAIAARAFSDAPELQALAVHHRLGRVPLGEPAVVVAAAAAHRDLAFDAARFVIDAVKVAVPLVKQELTEVGARWAPSATPLEDFPTQKDVTS